MSFIKDMAKELGDYASIASEGKGAGEFTGFVDTGCYILNAGLSGSIFGGLPNNKIVAFAGEPATGKTYLALGVVKHFLDSDKKAIVVYFESEAALTKDMLVARGIDTDRVLLVEPDTIQTFRAKAIKIIEAFEKQDESKRHPMLFVLDSLGMMSTTKEMEDTAEGKETRDMTKAQVIKATFRVLTLRLAKAKIPLILTNHVYDVTGNYVPTKVMGGGSGLKYAASLVVYLSKKKDREDKDVVGVLITAKMEKARSAKADTTFTMRLSYKTGLDKYYGLLELAEKYGIFKKGSRNYELPDGSKAFEKTINDNPEKYFTPDILIRLEEAAKQEFLYGTIDDDDDDEDLVEPEEDNHAE